MRISDWSSDVCSPDLFVLPSGGLVIGLAAGVICFFAATTIKNALGYDDSLDVWGVHGVGGIVGAILTGVFATSAVTGAEAPVGLIDGNPGQVATQLYGDRKSTRLNSSH